MNVPLLATEELQMVKEYIVLPVVLDVLEHDLKKLDLPDIKMREVYIRLLKGIQDQVLLLMLNNRTLLKKRGLRVYEQKRTSAGIEASYISRGYRHSISMLWDVIRSEIKIRLCGYLGIDFTERMGGRLNG